MTEPPSDFNDFEADARQCRRDVEELIEKWFGPRCDIECPACPCCRKWKQFDELFENPFRKVDQ